MSQNNKNRPEPSSNVLSKRELRARDRQWENEYRESHGKPERQITTKKVVAAGVGMLAVLTVGQYAKEAVQDSNAERELQDQLTSSHVVEDYNSGEIDKNKVVVIKVQDAGNGRADNIAIRINSKQSEEDGSMKTLRAQIHAQANSQGYIGVEQGETYVLRSDLVAPDAPGVEFVQVDSPELKDDLK